ncbi:MAG: PIN domain-containing protein [Oscillospiraceae bacterium]|jgi:predicted nucleic acid-binding protein|nr:PIN domain-containing protein [Oscillospiraceae bacterium]
MNVVIDTNIAIDLLKPNPDFEENAKAIFRLMGEHHITGHMCANSLTDIFYVLQKVIGGAGAKQTIMDLITAVNIIDLTAADCLKALKLPNPDFEDALVEICAEKIKAACIVTRDEKFKQSATTAKTLTPSELLTRLTAPPTNSRTI